MKRILLGLTMVTLASCGAKREVVQIVDGQDGGSCRTQQLENGSLISCDDGSFSYIYNGSNGLNGNSCSVESSEGGAILSCTDGSLVEILNGSDGKDGKNGKGCTIKDLKNGALVKCGNNSAVIYDGKDGENALEGAIGIASYIFPCGKEFKNDEILLRLTDGNILALYDGGPHEDRLVLLASGNYITTDRNKNKTCHFTVTEDLEIINEQVK